MDHFCFNVVFQKSCLFSAVDLWNAAARRWHLKKQGEWWWVARIQQDDFNPSFCRRYNLYFDAVTLHLKNSALRSSFLFRYTYVFIYIPFDAYDFVCCYYANIWFPPVYVQDVRSFCVMFWHVLLHLFCLLCIWFSFVFFLLFICF